MTRDGPLRDAAIPRQRLHYVHGLLHWLSRPFTLMLLAGPLLYWYFDVPTLSTADPLQFLAYGAGADRVLGLQRVDHALPRHAHLHRGHADRGGALAVSVSLASALFKPFGRPFRSPTRDSTAPAR